MDGPFLYSPDYRIPLRVCNSTTITAITANGAVLLVL